MPPASKLAFPSWAKDPIEISQGDRHRLIDPKNYAAIPDTQTRVRNETMARELHAAIDNFPLNAWVRNHPPLRPPPKVKGQSGATPANFRR